METMYDVLIVGAGNAALCAAIAAREHGARTLVLEKAPEYFRGGNTYFTGGIIRCASASSTSAQCRPRIRTGAAGRPSWARRAT